MTRRSFCRLFVIGFVSAIAGELEEDDDGNQQASL